jgi:hypothetical protein
LSGSRGSLYVRDFVLPHYGSELVFDVSNPVFDIAGCNFNMQSRTRRFVVDEYSNSAEAAQETNMFRVFANLALSGTPDVTWPKTALNTQKVVDACLQSARSEGAIVQLA